MQDRVFEWDGTNLPEEIRELPPGRYLVYSAEWMDEEENASSVSRSSVGPSSVSSADETLPSIESSAHQ